MFSGCRGATVKNAVLLTVWVSEEWGEGEGEDGGPGYSWRGVGGEGRCVCDQTAISLFRGGECF